MYLIIIIINGQYFWLTGWQDTNLNVGNKITYLADGQIISVDLLSGQTSVLINDLGPDCKIVPTEQTEARHSTDGIFYTCGDKTLLIVDLETPDERITFDHTVSTNVLTDS